ncbi:TIGR02281 family clan AA aspartic protease [uncultured Roseibium sp.]|uniref:retropepsin-like aspartic protease family protein n=1 Tax=uncultured Roseibium sp. TaxID=1936171 RepID=UPI0026344C85|nr:TIGR02281 family clan AA aspartic protease [uncultured Roseibium sp.]
MARFVLILLFFIGITPFLPNLLQKFAPHFAAGNIQSAETADLDDAPQGDRKHRISANYQGQFVDLFKVNGQTVEMLVDTGATHTVLPESVAREVGIFPKAADYKYAIRTANGTVYGAMAVIDGMQIGSIRLRNLDALVLKDQSLGQPLLGMSALNQLDRFDISNGTLVLIQ